MSDPILLLVGEDHQTATKILARNTWLKIAKSLVDTNIDDTSCKVVKMLEEHPNRSKKREMDGELHGYSRVIGFDDETTFSGGYVEFFKYAFKNTIMRHTAATEELSNAILLATGKDNGTCDDALQTIKEMGGIREIQLFLGKSLAFDALNNWFKSLGETEKKNAIRGFCKNQRPNLSDKDIENNVISIIKKNPAGNLYTALTQTTSKNVNRSEIRTKENKKWAKIIKKVGNDNIIDADVVVVFVGASHLNLPSIFDQVIPDNEQPISNKDTAEDKASSLQEHFKENLGPFSKVYIADNRQQENIYINRSDLSDYIISESSSTDSSPTKPRDDIPDSNPNS